jgi:hypothetical protein
MIGKWDQVRVLYLEQIAGLENLHIQVKEGLEHLRSETDHMQRIDEMIRKQRSLLDVTFQEFEQKQTLLQEKGECSFIESLKCRYRSLYSCSAGGFDRS